MKAEGVLAMPTAAQRIRMVCHLDVSRDMIERTLVVLGKLLGGSSKPAARSMAHA